VIAFIVVIEKLLNIAEKYSKKYGYNRLFQKIYKELMIMGFISFVIMLVSQKAVYKSIWFHAFEVVHIVIFFIAFFFVIQALGLIIFSILRGRRLSKFAQMSSQQIVKKFDQSTKSTDIDFPPAQWSLINYFFFYAPSSFRFPRVREAMEYKILETFFIRIHFLPTEFNFSKYLNESYKLYVMELVEVPPALLTLLMVIVVFNYIYFIILGSSTHKEICGVNKVHIFIYLCICMLSKRVSIFNQVNEVLDKGKEHEITFACANYWSEYAFTCACLLLVFSLIVLAISDMSMTQLMKCAILKIEEMKVEDEKDEISIADIEKNSEQISTIEANNIDTNTSKNKFSCILSPVSVRSKYKSTLLLISQYEREIKSSMAEKIYFENKALKERIHLVEETSNFQHHAIDKSHPLPDQTNGNENVSHGRNLSAKAFNTKQLKSRAINIRKHRSFRSNSESSRETKQPFQRRVLAKNSSFFTSVNVPSHDDLLESEQNDHNCCTSFINKGVSFTVSIMKEVFRLFLSYQEESDKDDDAVDNYVENSLDLSTLYLFHSPEAYRMTGINPRKLFNKTNYF
jgi:hypothetical protein